MAVEWYRGIPFPMPDAVFLRFWHLLLGEAVYEKKVWEHFFTSLSRWMLAYAMAVILGLALGWVCALEEKSYHLAMKVATILQVMPGLAWIPFAMLLFGIGEKATLFMIVMSAFPPIFLHVSSGYRAIPQERFLLSRMMNLSVLRKFWMVILPSMALPLLTGLRMGLAIGWRVLIAAEMVVGSSVGLGYTIIQARWSLDFEVAFISIGLICAVGLLVEKWGFERLERVLKKRLSA